MRIGGSEVSLPRRNGKVLLSPLAMLSASLLLAALVLLAPGDILVSRASYGPTLPEPRLTDGEAGTDSAALLSLGNDVWVDFQPGIQWVRSPITCTVTATDPDGLKPNTARYRTSTDGGGTWTDWYSTNITASLAMVSSTVYMTVTDLAFPDSPVLNQIQFLIQDRDDPNNLEESDPYTLLVDGTEPDSTVTTGGDYSLSSPWPGQIEGTASDTASDVKHVDITIQRISPPGYWNGFSWQTPAVWLRASGGSGGWNYAFTPNDGKSYGVESLATDNAGNVQSVAASGVFTYDITAPAAPTITLVDPAATYTADNCFTVTWDSPLDFSGIAGVYFKFNAPPVSNADYDGFDPEGGITGLYCIPVPAEGKNDIYIWLVDGAGNVDFNNRAQALDMLWYDASEPESTVTTAGYYGGPTVWPGQIEGTASDAGSDVQYVDITIKRDFPEAYWNGFFWQTPPIWLRATGGSGGWSYAFIPDSNHVYAVESIATDNASNVQSIAATSVFTYDGAAPLAPVVTLVAPEAVFTNTNCFTITWESPTDYSGIAGAYYKFNAPPVSNDDGVFVAEADISGLTCLPVPNEGKNDIYIWLADGIGNADYHNRAERLDAFWYDATAPVASAGYDRLPDHAPWFNNTVTLLLQCNDPGDGSGCAYTEWRLQGEAGWNTGDHIVVSDDSRRAYEFRAVDHAANVQDPPAAQTVLIDTHAPATNHQLSEIPGPSGWVSAPVTVTLIVSDVVSGEAETYYRVDDGPVESGKTFVVSGDGSHKVEYRSEDNAGNTEDWHVYPGLVQIDSGAPTTVADTPSVSGCDGWLTDESVTVHLVATDPGPGPGLAYTEYRLMPDGSWLEGDSFTETREGVWEYQYRSVDLADNVEQAKTVTLGIDRTAPGEPRNVQADPATWTNVPNFTLTWDDPLVPEDVSPIKTAYYKLDVAPIGDYDGTAVPPDGNSIDLVVDGEGAHGVSLWLEDCAGNIDYRNNRQELLAFKYDASPPETGCVLTGTEGEEGWYVSPVHVGLVPQDSVSAVAQTFYRIDGGAWQEGASFGLSSQGWRQKVEYYSVDLAGNQEATNVEWISIDTVPPLPPFGLSVQPSTCSQENGFSASWSNPTNDISNISGVFYKLGGVPLGPLDFTGHFDYAVESIPDLELPGQGEFGFYVWLEDGAGNTDHHSIATAVLCYDSTPPSTDATVVAGTLGLEGWYLTPVTLRLNASDAVAGLQRIDYRVDGGAWHQNSVIGKTGYIDLDLASEGQHKVDYRSLDQGGNLESTGQKSVKIDLTPPTATVTAPYYTSSNSFSVSWEGDDPTPGGSVAFYDVQYKRDLTGGWADWKTHTASTSGTFTNADRGHLYYFSVSATDAAGRRGEWSGETVCTWVDSIQNGSFGGGLGSWKIEGALPVMHRSSSQACGTEPEIVLGNPELGSAEYGGVPIGRAAVSQRFRVPWLTEAPALSLSFKYRIVTYDWADFPNDPQDTFDVVVKIDEEGEDLVLRDGARERQGDLGCHEFTLDLSPYAGKFIRIELSNWNRHDDRYNTWTYVDDLRVFIPHTIRLPVVYNGYPRAGGAGTRTDQSKESALDLSSSSLEQGRPRFRPVMERAPR